MDKERAAASLIYYLMTRDVPIDPWHILTSDEVLLYHGGAPMIQLLLYPDGRWEEVVLGPEVDKGQVMQKVIPAGTWMGFVKRMIPAMTGGSTGSWWCRPGTWRTSAWLMAKPNWKCLKKNIPRP